jgi:hypothetical protein
MLQKISVVMLFLFHILLLPSYARALSATTPLSNDDSGVSRRSVLGGTASIVTSWGLLSSPSFAASTSIASRLEKDTLNFPPPSKASKLKGVDNLYFPSFLQGEWDVTQTLVDASTPLGLKFIGGPNGLESIAKASIDQVRSEIGVPVKLRLQYLPTKWGIAEDRLFNTQERLNAFAGKRVVASCSYADVGDSNRKSMLAMGGTEQDPLMTTLVFYRGPAAQKVFVFSHDGETTGENSWAGYEVQRSIFALTNTNTAPPITTDSEYIWTFDRLDEDHVQGKLRIAGYLNPQSDTLYFDARNRAVSLQDYNLDMRRCTSTD